MTRKENMNEQKKCPHAPNVLLCGICLFYLDKSMTDQKKNDYYQITKIALIFLGGLMIIYALSLILSELKTITMLLR